MQLSDANEIARLEEEAFSDAWTEKGILDTFHQQQAFVVVGEMDDKVVGYCIMYYVLDEGEIARIAVDDNCKRQGVGRAILNQVECICKEKEITRILLDVRESNGAARAFYRNYGFVEDGIRKNFYEMPKEHAVLMSKDVTW
jgi:ribosomal-protein-alanine N-acetyltransferase